MTTALQIALLVPFTLGGCAKLALPYQRFAALPFQEWAEDFQPVHIRAIGSLEVAAAIASATALASGALPMLAAGSAIAMALVMAGAMATHLRRSEYPNLLGNLLWLVAALVVASNRFYDHVA